jgi:hypothetical protein
LSLFVTVRRSKVGEQALSTAPSKSALPAAPSSARVRPGRGSREKAPEAPVGRL